MESSTFLPETYTCVTSRLSNINESETLTAVYGTHMSGKTNNDVGFIQIYNVLSLTFFPKGIENFFPNLIAIEIQNCNINAWNGHELDVFSNLQWFYLAYQPNLERIPGNLFAKTPLLHTIYLYSNNIKHVGANLLDSLEHLEYASFSNNYCVNKGAGSSSQMPSLIEHLRTNCTDIEECDVCAKIESVAVHNEVMSGTINGLVEKNVEMSKNFESLEGKLIELSQENSRIKQLLSEVLEGILELTTRP